MFRLITVIFVSAVYITY